LTMDAAHTMTAIYIVGRTLTVDSLNPNTGVNITVTPNDNNAQGNGTTQFTRLYDVSTVVNLTAPAAASGTRWTTSGSPGSPSSGGSALSTTRQLGHAATAESYSRPHSGHQAMRAFSRARRPRR